MYCKLKDDFCLRGWELLPTGMVRRLSGEVGFFPPKVYRAIIKACSALPVESPLFSPEEREMLKELLAAGILEESPAPAPLTARQAYRAYPNRFLRSVHWAVTGNCNSRCRHCYMSAPSGGIGEFSHEECMRIVEEMAAAGVRTVSLTGGEALLRRDFFDIVDALAEADILVNVVMSNGFLVNEETLDAFEERGIRPEFNISFDGVGCHDWLRGVAGAEEAAVRAFALCRERGFPTGAEYCLHRGNLAALRESVKLLSSLGVSALKVNRLSLEGEGAGLADYAISREEEFRAYLDYIPAYYEDDLSISLMLSGFFAGAKQSHHAPAPALAHPCASLGDAESCSIPFVKNAEDEDCGNDCICGHARNMMYITPEGYIVPCIPMGSTRGGRQSVASCDTARTRPSVAVGGRQRFPNIRELSLAKALRDSSYLDFIDTRLRDYFAHNPGCGTCEYRNRCSGGCRGRVAGGDLLARDEDACAFFREGWYDKLLELLAGANRRITLLPPH